MPENLNPEQQLEYLKELRKKYEEVLKDAEKSGDYSEAEKLKLELEKRLTVLETVMGANNVENQEVESKEVTETRAREIMGEDFFGPNEVEKAFGKAIADTYYNTDNSILPYSERQLFEAKRIGERLIFRVGHYSLVPNITHNITMKELYENAKARMTPDEFAKINNLTNYNNEYFYSGNLMKTRWVLVKKDFLAGSNNKDYLGQTRILRDYLKALGVLTTEELQSCDDSILNKIDELQNKDWSIAAKQLSSLLINQNHRRSPLEAFYDWMLLSKNGNKISYIDYSSDLTNGLNSHNQIIATSCNSNSMTFKILEFHPRNQGPNCGVVSVR